MTPGQQRLVEGLFLAALDLPAAARDDFLDRSSPNPRLRREVGSCLSAHGEMPEGFLRRPACIRLGTDNDADAETADGDAPEAAIAASAAEPDRLGPYALLRRIGEGGMGAIYLARRDDDEFRREVAIKLLRGSRAGRAMLRRFRVERQILAILDHPNIARLHDGGTTADGRPYFVMEYVEGEPITDY